MNLRLIQVVPRHHLMSARIGSRPRDSEKDKRFQIVDGRMGGWMVPPVMMYVMMHDFQAHV